MTRTARLLSGPVLLAGGCLVCGCEPPPPSPQELGRIVFSESEVPGADKVYTLPDYLLELKSNETPEGRPPGE